MRLTWFLAALLALTVPAAADDDAYGAVGVNTKNGFVLFVTEATKDAAERAVEEGCERAGEDCDVKHWYTGACVALARSANDDSYGLSIKDTRAEAQQDAVKVCAEHDGQGCNVHDTYCAGQ